jgi:hypothetical protein
MKSVTCSYRGFGATDLKIWKKEVSISNYLFKISFLGARSKGYNGEMLLKVYKVSVTQDKKDLEIYCTAWQ